MKRNYRKWHASVSREMRRGLLSVWVLWILSKGKPMYGYEIIQNIRARTKGRWVLKAGTMYPILRRLESRGFVRSEWSRARAAGPSRRYYKITPQGKKASRRIFLEWKKLMSGFREFLSELFGVG
jgi:DNA-binding PadR family transcriptional regulator